MADGDTVHGQPNFYYKKPYEALCEGRNDSGWLVLGALQKDIKRHGNFPIILIKEIAQYLTQKIKNGQTNWDNLSKELEQIKNRYLNSIPHYPLSTTWRSIKRVFNEFKNKDRTETHNLRQVMIGQYMKELYQSKFEDRIDPNCTHHKNIDPEVLTDRVLAIEPEIFQTINKWAEIVAKDEDVTKLRRPNRKNIQPIDMNEDLLVS